jgi:hypothetical protein
MRHRWVHVLAISIFVSISLTGSLARAQSCYEKCQNSCKDMRGIVNQGCVDNCNRAYCSGSNNAQSHPYGSIAFALGTGFEGISWGKATQAEADRSALATCSQYGKNCKIVYQYHDTCAALAVSKAAQHFAAAIAETDKKAEAASVKQCQDSWGVCKSNLSACSP